MVGKEILGYQVNEKIGAGGFGTVYKVSKTNAAGTYVRALKHITLPTKKQYMSVLNSMGGDYAKADDYFASALNDIVNEIKILSTLSESGVNNIVRYYENDIIETQSPKTYNIYIMMEYLTPFTDYVESKTFTVKDVIGLGKGILNALIACHAKGIIHRDIKDDNIFVSPEGVYKLGDFGVSKALKDKSRAESVKGTPNFIAPEVYLGKEKYDETVDLYSLGIVLYKLLNKSRNPFLPAFPAPYNTNDEDAAFEARMTGKIPELPVSAQNELGEVVLKAISPRAERFDSAEDFLDALEQVEKNMTEEALSEVVCEALSHDFENSFAISVNGKNISANETIAVDCSDEMEEADRTEDRHLFDTFAMPSVTQEKAKEEASFTPIMPAKQEEPKITKEIIKEYEQKGCISEVETVTKKSINSGKVRKIIIFSLPLVLLFGYVCFFAWLLPAAYGKAVTFFDWLFMDISKIKDVLHNVTGIFSSIYTVIALIVLHYVLLIAIVASLFFACKELHNPKKHYTAAVKYTGKTPQMMLDNILVSMKHNPVATDKVAMDTLRMVADSLKFSKGFGLSKEENLINLEKDICELIDEMQVNVVSDKEEVLAKMSDTIALLKQKNLLRDAMLKK